MTHEDPRILELRRRRTQALEGGGAERIARQHARGKKTARDRLALLFDPGTFQELGMLTTARCVDADERFAGDGVITGFGLVDGRTVYAYAQDATIFGGALGEMHGRKICQVMDLAAESGVPLVGLIDSGGARIQEGVYGMGGYAEIFRRNALYSGVIPQISLLLGPCAGGAAYSPALTDLLIMVEKHSYMFLTGPEVVRAVTGEVVDAEQLGGALMHISTSGLAHFVAPTETTAIRLTQRLLSYLPANYLENSPQMAPREALPQATTVLNSIVPLDPGQPYSMHTVIQNVVDAGSFLEVQEQYARNAIVGLARIDGHSVGIVAQEPEVLAGALDIDASDKITRFVRFCDAFNIPLVTFVDTPGFLPGINQEYHGIIRHGAKIVYAYATATVPKISIVTRKAYGGAYVVMSSKHLGTDVTLAWPSAEIAVMGGEGAAAILFRKEIAAAPDPEAARQSYAEAYRDHYLNPYVAAEGGFIDEVIEPAETRSRLIRALTALRQKAVIPMGRRHGNMPA
ncbi:MAG: acyl-CoA carboxylase subunit beta [Caldilineaceae bacterium]|nr:acyl-CoA carboxylase subunit beta [Caldilineaceae bacterium]MBP9073194.1 acyl-CoA carboxylase subunit beta [Caldilineaceae bacterium]